METLGETIQAGLTRKAITRPSDWALKYRVMGKPFPGKWTFDHHPWLKGIMDCDAERVIGEKAAQMGYTEAALNKSFYTIDILGGHVGYILPANKPDASDFSSGRVEPAIEACEHLEKIFDDVRNVGYKRAGLGGLYVRGSKSRSQLKSFPAELLILDEIDEFVQDNIPMIYERQSGQPEVSLFELSTPTVHGKGIDANFLLSTQDHFFFKCPCCSRMTELIFPDCLVIAGEDSTSPRIKETHLQCKECKGRLEHETKMDWLQLDNCEWVKQFDDRLYHGFHVGQLYSMTEEPYKLAIAYLQGQSNPAQEIEFYNSKLGMPHEIKGARINAEDIEDCKSDYKKQDVAPANSLVTMGVDIGFPYCFVEITQWFIDSKAMTYDINLKTTGKVLMEKKVTAMEDLDELMHKYNVRYCVIDANPERRKAMEFAERFRGRVALCIYGSGRNTKQITVRSEELSITVDRTSWLDLALGRIKSRRLKLPVDTSVEYEDHLKALVRTYKKDENGNPMAYYVNGTDHDHFAHARNYNEIALPMGASLVTGRDLRDIL